jgi:hypothetical protein
MLLRKIKETAGKEFNILERSLASESLILLRGI